MKDDPSIDDPRRRFLENAGRAASLAPAIGLLLAASVKGAQAANPYGQTPEPPVPFVPPTPVYVPPTPQQPTPQPTPPQPTPPQPTPNAPTPATPTP